jgi:hypothetical protein
VIRTGRDPGLAAAPDYRAVLGQPAPQPSPADLAYWAAKCRGAKPIELRPQENAGGDHRTRVSDLVVPAADFLRLVRTNQVMPQAALYAMMHALIAADTGDPDVVLYTVNGARHSPEQEQTVGMFVDEVLLRRQAAPDLSFVDSIRGAADELNATYRHAGATTATLSQAVPDMLGVISRSPWVSFEMITPVAGLKLAGCSIRRSEPWDAGYAGLEYHQPVELNVIARQEGTARRLIAEHDTPFLPAHYVDGLLERMRDIVVACGEDGERPIDTVVTADPWLRGR